MQVIVTKHGAHEALLDWGQGARRAAIGRGGIATKNREGDGVTPAGTYPFRRVLYRSDRMVQPITHLPVAVIMPNDGWCDAPMNPKYNQQVKRPYRAGSEALWRDDHLYDVLAVIGFNDQPVVQGKGSAIFLHVARPAYSATDGCVAMAQKDLLDLLSLLGPGDTIAIRA